jgi:hypothetical protein
MDDSTLNRLRDEHDAFKLKQAVVAVCQQHDFRYSDLRNAILRAANAWLQFGLEPEMDADSDPAFMRGVLSELYCEIAWRARYERKR